MDLSTNYLGLSLKNPIIVASCGLTKTVDQIKRCEQAGAGAVVMKSLLEEQIRESEADIEDDLGMHSEVMGYLQADIGMRYGSDTYTDTIEQAKKEVSIPVIASVNCYTSKWWTNYAKQLEDGIEAIKSALKTENAADIKGATENLNKSWQSVAQKMYQTASTDQEAAGAAHESATSGGASEDTGPKGDEKVVDADYEIIDDEKKN